MGSGVKTAVFGVQWGACPLPESPDLVVVVLPPNSKAKDEYNIQ